MQIFRVFKLIFVFSSIRTRREIFYEKDYTDGLSENVKELGWRRLMGDREKRGKLIRVLGIVSDDSEAEILYSLFVIKRVRLAISRMCCENVTCIIIRERIFYGGRGNHATLYYYYIVRQTVFFRPGPETLIRLRE